MIKELSQFISSFLTSNEKKEYSPNDIFKIGGFSVGQAQDFEAATGVTVLRFDKGATVGVDVRGAAPGSRETELLKPENTLDKVHAIVLSGGCAFGLSSMSGVMDDLEKEGIGFDVGVAKVPIVTGAVIFDLAIGDPNIRPDAEMGKEASQNANRIEFIEGTVGAGTGATIGKIAGADRAVKSGIGSYFIELEHDVMVAAIVVVNAWGDVIKSDNVYAGIQNGNKNGFISGVDLLLNGDAHSGFVGANTTIGAIITNATLTKSQALKIAQMGHDGFARAINPVHSMYDGDTLFAAGTGEVIAPDLNVLGIAAAEAVQAAIYRAVSEATSLDGVPSRKDIL